jgi:hypothetical protein
MGPPVDLHYTLAVQRQADIARDVSQYRLAARARAGRAGGEMADGRLHGAAAIRLAHALTHAGVHVRRGRDDGCEGVAQPRHAD